MPNTAYILLSRVGACIGHYRLALGLPSYALGPPGFLDTNMLVAAMRILALGVTPNAKPQHKAPIRMDLRSEGL